MISMSLKTEPVARTTARKGARKQRQVLTADVWSISRRGKMIKHQVAKPMNWPMCGRHVVQVCMSAMMCMSWTEVNRSDVRGLLR